MSERVSFFMITEMLGAVDKELSRVQKKLTRASFQARVAAGGTFRSRHLARVRLRVLKEQVKRLKQARTVLRGQQTEAFAPLYAQVIAKLAA